MTIVIYITIIISFLYLIIAFLTFWGLKKKSHSQNIETPFVSVIIAARNEEKYIQNCLNSLKKLNYPSEKIEYLLINDRSTDSTGQYLKQFDEQVKNSRIINVSKLLENRTGKINALIPATQAAKGDLFLFTDADCEVPEDWVQSFIKHFGPKTGMIGGFLVLDRLDKKSPVFHCLQSLDWIFLCTIGFGWTNLAMPLSVFGNNIAIKKCIYEESGGFESIGNNITEDYALLKNVLSRTTAQVNFILDVKNAVYTKPVNTIQDFFTQRKRWAVSSYKRNLLSVILLLISFLFRIMIIINLLFQNYIIGLTALLLLTLLDTATLFYPLKKLNRLYLLKYLFPFEIYVTVYQLILAPVALFAKKIQWKSDKYSIDKKILQ
ncbi:MAG: glycosyltransferase [bacterium]